MERLLQRQYEEMGGKYPESIAVVLWGTDNIKTYGESLGQVRGLGRAGLQYCSTVVSLVFWTCNAERCVQLTAAWPAFLVPTKLCKLRLCVYPDFHAAFLSSFSSKPYSPLYPS